MTRTHSYAPRTSFADVVGDLTDLCFAFSCAYSKTPQSRSVRAICHHTTHAVVPHELIGAELILVAKAAVVATTVALVAVSEVAAGSSGTTINRLEHQVKVLQHQVYVLNRSADAYGLKFGNNGRQLVCILVQRPSFGRQVTVLPAYKCAVSG